MNRSLGLSIADGALHAVMLGVSESYLGALAVELGYGNTALALLATVPLLVGAVSQLLAGQLARFFGSHRNMVVSGALIQAFCNVGFFAIAWTQDKNFWIFLAVKTTFWFSGSIIAPVWNSWMIVLSSKIDRERYFAWRSAAVYLALLVSYLGAGFLLEHGRKSDQLFDVFCVLFAAAAIVRLSSLIALAFHADVEIIKNQIPFFRAIGKAIAESRWRMPIYVAVVMLGVHVAAPFYTPYMLRTLQLDYSTYAMLTAISILTKAVSFPTYHTVARHIGLKTTLFLAGLGVALVAYFWGSLTTVAALFVVEIFSGIVWAGFEFSSFQIFIHNAGKGTEVYFFSLTSSMTGSMQLCGSLAGSAALAHLRLAYKEIFLCSSVGRALALLIFLPAFSPVAMFKTLPRIFTRIVSVRSVAGAEQHLITHEEAEEATRGDDIV
ncbi:MAG: MFS transporter [Pseudomonadota bacterium]